MTDPQTPPEIRHLNSWAHAITNIESDLIDAVDQRNDAIVAAHANHAIPMADIYTAARLSPGMVHRILTRAGAPHRPRGGRPAKTETAP